MPRFRTFIRGEHFLLESDGQIHALGFYTTRFIEAADHSAAEFAAVDLIRADQKLCGSIRNNCSDPPQIFIDQIEEIEEIEEIELIGVPAINSGYTFCPEDESSSTLCGSQPTDAS